MADLRFTDLTEKAAPDSTDFLAIADLGPNGDGAGTPEGRGFSKKVTFSSVKAFLTPQVISSVFSVDAVSESLAPDGNKRTVVPNLSGTGNADVEPAANIGIEIKQSGLYEVSADVEATGDGAFLSLRHLRKNGDAPLWPPGQLTRHKETNPDNQAILESSYRGSVATPDGVMGDIEYFLNEDPDASESKRWEVRWSAETVFPGQTIRALRVQIGFSDPYDIPVSKLPGTGYQIQSGVQGSDPVGLSPTLAKGATVPFRYNFVFTDGTTAYSQPLDPINSFRGPLPATRFLSLGLQNLSAGDWIDLAADFEASSGQASAFSIDANKAKVYVKKLVLGIVS